MLYPFLDSPMICVLLGWGSCCLPLSIITKSQPNLKIVSAYLDSFHLNNLVRLCCCCVKCTSGGLEQLKSGFSSHLI